MTSIDRPRLVLGSASPRRSELLRAAGLAFEVVVPDVDETLDPDLAPADAARELAERKARAAAVRSPRDAIVLAADTIVAVPVGGVARLLGKPADAEGAAAMLRLLSGSRHEVLTGVAALRVEDGALESASERTIVTMRTITAEEIDAYVASGEWRDKAGAYAIQESADRFVTRLEEGGFDNVVGLPVALALSLVERVAARA